MKLPVLSASLILLTATSFAQRKTPVYELSPGAVVIETRPVKTNRALLLWMIEPKKNPRDTPDEPYTCPEETRGSFFHGATRVSLVEAKTDRVINTIKIQEEESELEDVFDIPYRIHAGSYYHVEAAGSRREGKPTIMWLRDYNGDGRPLEFALFDALACMGLRTTLIGYSERQDKVIQYPVRLTVEEKGKRSIDNKLWADYLFSEKPKSPGYWQYEIDYRGRGGSLDKYEIRFNGRTETFEGKVESIEDK